MPNDDLTVGRCEALSDALASKQGWWPKASEAARWEHFMTPLEHVDHLIKQEQKQKNKLEERINESNAKLESLRSLRAKLLSDPECAKAVQAALELLR